MGGRRIETSYPATEGKSKSAAQRRRRLFGSQQPLQGLEGGANHSLPVAGIK